MEKKSRWSQPVFPKNRKQSILQQSHFCTFRLFFFFCKKVFSPFFYSVFSEIPQNTFEKNKKNNNNNKYSNTQYFKH